MKKDNLLILIAKEIKKQKGTIFEVGGTVRDSFLNLNKKDKDIDCEVYGLSALQLEKILSSFGKVDLTGKSFAVYRIFNLEISLPRKDRKIGDKHQDFYIKVSPFLPYREACLRRDFTVNAIMRNVLTGEIIDPLNGISDIKKGIIRAADMKHFAEDPLRPYRAARFAAYLGFSIDLDTIKLCRKIIIDSLPYERIFGELKKILVEAKYPGRGIQILLDMGLFINEPLINKMVLCPQEPMWHPEGNVFLHTLLSLNTAVTFREKLKKKDDKLVLMLSVMFHDIGKVFTTRVETSGKKKGRIISPGHQSIGVKYAGKILKKWKVPNIIIKRVKSLISAHHRIYDLWIVRDKITAGAIRRLLRDVEIEILKSVFISDKFGRGQKLENSVEVKWLEQKIKELKIEKNQLKPIIMGRDLLSLGLKQSPKVGIYLKEIYNAQLDGLFLTKEEGLELSRKLLFEK